MLINYSSAIIYYSLGIIFSNGIYSILFLIISDSSWNSSYSFQYQYWALLRAFTAMYILNVLATTPKAICVINLMQQTPLTPLMNYFSMELLSTVNSATAHSKTLTVMALILPIHPLHMLTATIYFQTVLFAFLLANAWED